MLLWPDGKKLLTLMSVVCSFYATAKDETDYIKI
jgi:hypothetical protein